MRTSFAQKQRELTGDRLAEYDEDKSRTQIENREGDTSQCHMNVEATTKRTGKFCETVLEKAWGGQERKQRRGKDRSKIYKQKVTRKPSPCKINPRQQRQKEPG
jgi:hypothetical protein